MKLGWIIAAIIAIYGTMIVAQVANLDGKAGDASPATSPAAVSD
jgi:hypothetical protein